MIIIKVIEINFLNVSVLTSKIAGNIKIVIEIKLNANNPILFKI